VTELETARARIDELELEVAAYTDALAGVDEQAAHQADQIAALRADVARLLRAT